MSNPTQHIEAIISRWKEEGTHHMSAPIGSFGDLNALDAASGTPDLAAPAPDLPASGGPQMPAIAWSAQGAPSVAMPGVYITLDDQLQLTCWNSNSALTSLTLQLRILKPDGTIVIGAFTLPQLTSDRVANKLQVGQLEGFLVGAVIGPPGVALARGSTFVNLALVRGTPTNPLMTLVLIADYVTSALQPGWPYGRVLSAVEGSGLVRLAIGSVPAAGAEVTLAQSAATRWRIQSIVLQLTTSVAAANRQVNLLINPPGGTIYRAGAPAVQIANTITTYTFAPNLPWVNTSTQGQLIPLPSDLIIDGSTFLQSSTAFEQAGDQYAAMQVSLEEWIDV